MGLCSFRGTGVGIFARAPLAPRSDAVGTGGTAPGRALLRRIAQEGAEPTRFWSAFIRQLAFYIGNSCATAEPALARHFGLPTRNQSA